VARLIAGLPAASAHFAALWNGHDIAALHETHKAIEHPQLGLLRLDCDVLRVDGADLRVVLFTARPGRRRPTRSASWHRSRSRRSSKSTTGGPVRQLYSYAAFGHRINSQVNQFARVTDQDRRLTAEFEVNPFQIAAAHRRDVSPGASAPVIEIRSGHGCSTRAAPALRGREFLVVAGLADRC
jgi:hypothetical protein